MSLIAKPLSRPSVSRSCLSKLIRVGAARGVVVSVLRALFDWQRASQSGDTTRVRDSVIRHQNTYIIHLYIYR